MREMIKKALKLIHWSDFHLSSLGGVVLSFPGVPVDTISERWVCAMMIDTVQVGCVTVLVPPGSFKAHSTVSVRAVIILIFGWKGLTTKTRKRISCCPCTKTREYDYVWYRAIEEFFSLHHFWPQSKLLKPQRKANNQRKQFLRKNQLYRQIKRHLNLDLSKFNNTGKELMTWVRSNVELVLSLLARNCKHIVFGVSSFPCRVFQIYS